jgi:hypothetical protein
MLRALPIALIAACSTVCAQQRLGDESSRVTVAAVRDPVEKSYRKVIQGMDYCQLERTALAPDSSLRFKLLPRKRGTDMEHIVLKLVGSTFAYEVPGARLHASSLWGCPRADGRESVRSASSAACGHL